MQQIQPRNIAISIILSIVTCGIYSIYWFVCMTNEVNALANPPKQTSGGIAFLLTVITCNIYGLYWAYNMGQNLDIAASQRGQMVQNRGVLYLILQLVVPVVAYALMQDTINQLIDAKTY